MAAEVTNWRTQVAMAATIAAVVVPTLVVHWVVIGYLPFGQLVAAFFWSLAVALWGVADPSSPVPWRRLAPLFSALVLLAIGILMTSVRSSGAPGPMLLSLGLLTLASAVAATSARLMSGVHASHVEGALAIGLAVAAFLGSLLAFIQWLLPEYSGNLLVAREFARGRPGGNMLQPNHLATLLVWGVLAAILLVQSKRLTFGAATALIVVVSMGIGVTGSRAGLLQLALLAAWGVWNKQMPRRFKVLLGLAPICVIVFQLALQFGGGDVTESAQRHLGRTNTTRLDIASWAWQAILDRPWIGHGWNETGGSWALSGYGVHQQYTAVDHTHNLVLNLAVELGIPLAAAIIGLLLTSIVLAWNNVGHAARRWLLVMVVAVALHSAVEFPLWFAYFLLPTAFMLGACLGSASPAPVMHSNISGAVWRVGGVASCVLTLAVLSDLGKALIAINTPPETPSAPVRGRTYLFGHLTASTEIRGVERPDLALFARARYGAITIETLEAWARALAREGRIDEARYLAERTRSLLESTGSRRVIPCDDRVGPTVGLPCGEPATPIDWHKIR